MAGVAAAKTLKEEFAGGAISVGSDNIQTFFSESKNKFILEFYAPWCGHCERFGPSLDEIAREFHSVEDFYYVGKVDITKNDALTGRFDISHIPSLFLNSEEDKFYTYDGGQMTKSAVIEWVRRGHKQHVPINVISEAGKLDAPIIVGGGIRTLNQISEIHEAGANVAVIGNKIEEDIDFLLDIKSYLQNTL